MHRIELLLAADVKPIARAARFIANDQGGAPFGCFWLSGITPARLGLVELVCIAFSFRQSTAFLAGPLPRLVSNIVWGAHIYLAASLPMLVLVTLTDRRTAAAANRTRITALSIAVLVGAAAYAVGIALAFGLGGGWNYPSANPIWLAFPLLGYFLRALLMGGLLTAVLYFISREAAIRIALQTARLTRIQLDRQMTEAQLSVLQAQIEPHFLFNTLAHIKRLHLIDATRGKAMLHDLAAYLRAALPQMRDSSSTLGRELEHARAYLNVLQGRMGERLEVCIVVPNDLHAAELPPLMLSTLVENAIKHGIAPLPQGGVIKIAAMRAGARLKISVADNGVGFQGASGAGVGLANTRARLAALYGDSGHLTLSANPIRGVTVAIELPYKIPPMHEVPA